MNDLSAFQTPARAAAFEPERVFPTAPKPQPPAKRRKFGDKLRELQERRRLRALDRRQERLGAAGRMHTRWEANGGRSARRADRRLRALCLHGAGQRDGPRAARDLRGAGL